MEHLYFHIPWCRQKCNYCSFYSGLEFDFDEYLAAAQKRLAAFPTFKPITVYFGGGTPSLLTYGQLGKLLSCLDLARVQELSIEANPFDITSQFARSLKELGFTRVSLGMQSFLDSELQLLGRRSDSRQNIAAFHTLRSVGFDNISLDLIYGLPGQTQADLDKSLEKFLLLRPEHISTYLLTLEQGVPMFAQKQNLPGDDQLADFYAQIRKKLLQAGYCHYELSNFCLPGYRSQHNLAYWQDKQYLALGKGGCSYYQKGDKFLRTDGHGGVEELSLAQRESEFILLSLRLATGIILADYRKKFGSDFRQKYRQFLAKYAEFLLVDDKRVALKPKDYFVADELIALALI